MKTSSSVTLGDRINTAHQNQYTDYIRGESMPYLSNLKCIKFRRQHFLRYYGIHAEISRTYKPLTISTFQRKTNCPLSIIQYKKQPRHTTGLKYSRATPRLSSWSTHTTYQRICSCIYSHRKQFRWIFKPRTVQLHRCYRRSTTLQCRPKHRNLSTAADRSLTSCGTTVTLFRYVVTADTTPSTTVQRSLANQMH